MYKRFFSTSSVNVALTGVNVRDHDFRALLREKTSCLSADALSTAGDDRSLPSKHATGIVQMARDLGCSLLG